jgi:hypothetical protein
MRKVRYLVAGAASLAKPLFLGTVAVGIGLGDSGGIASAFLRCLIFPSVAPAVCMLFLYADEERYRAYRPLAGLLAAGSAIFLAATILPGLRDSQKLALAARDAHTLARTVAAFLAAFFADLLCGFALLPDSRKRGAAPRDDASTQIPLPDKER